MPLVLADRVKETTTTVGTGTVTLDGAATGYQSFAVIGNGNTTYYTIAGQGTSEWEVGIGTYTSSGTTLSRDTVLASSAGAPNKTSFSAGAKDVFVTYTAARAVIVDGFTLDTTGMGASQGEILFASATDTFSRLGKSTTATRYLANTGSLNNPIWDRVDLTNGVIGALPIANGGSGQTSAQDAMNAFAGAVTSGSYLRGNGTNVVMSAIQAADVPTLNQNTTGNAATATTANALNASNSYTIGGGNYIRFGPNPTWAATLQVGGDGVNGITRTASFASVVTTDGNLHLDSGTSKTMYLNWYSGTGGIIFGNGAAGQCGSITAAGALTMNGNVTAFSDERYKTNWRSVAVNFVEKLAQVRSGVYDRTDQGVTQAGVSAQSLQEILPETVLEDESGRLSVAYGNAALVACVELAKEIVKLRAEIDALKKEV